MRFLAIVFISLGVACYVSCQSLGDPALQKFLEDLRQKLQDGDPETGFPSLHPLDIPEIVFNSQSDLLKANMKLTNVYSEGIANFSIEYAHVVGIAQHFDIELKFTPIMLHTEYDGSLKALDMLNLFGKGKIDLLIGGIDIRVRLTRKFANANETVQFNKLRIDKLAIEKTTASIDGLFNDVVKSKMINDELAAVLDMATPDASMVTLGNELAPMLLPLINGMMTVTLEDLISGIGREVPMADLYNQFLKISNEL